MSFKLHPEADNWFRRIDGQQPFESKFDVYYLCAMIGFQKGRSEPLENGNEFVKDFTQRFRPYQILLVGRLISSVLKRKGIHVDERAAVVKEISALVNGAAASGELTPEGVRELNEYAAGGFNYLREQLSDMPNNPIYLLSRCKDILVNP